MKDWRKTNKRRNEYKWNKWLRQLRLRYIWKFRKQIAFDRTGRTLEFCARQMVMHELYKNPSLRDARYAILRQMWRFDKRSGLRWHDWTEKNGWNSEWKKTNYYT